MSRLLERLRRREDRGATAVVFALALSLLLGMVALAVDVSYLTMQRQTLQDTSDAAAQIAVSRVNQPGQARNLAADYMAQYAPADAQWQESLWCVQPVGRSGGVCTPDPLQLVCDDEFCVAPAVPGQANAVEIQARTQVKLFFAPAIGLPSATTGVVRSVVCVSCRVDGGATSLFIRLPDAAVQP